MGFWDITKRVIQGKPAFEAPKEEDVWEDEAPTIEFADERAAKRQNTDDKNLYDEKGYKQIPTVTVTNVNSKQNGDRIELWVTVSNQSERDIKLDKITLLGSKFIMDYPLSPGSQRVFQVYNGSQIKHDNYKKAELYYQDVLTNDYFRADHLIEYRYEVDGTYDINDFQLITPIRDL